MKITIVRAQVEHCPPIADRVRAADRAELWATCCLDPYQALVRSWAISDHSWTALFDEEPACMFGVTQASLLTDSGRPWMISTDLVDRYPMSFLKEQKPFMVHIWRRYAQLENYVDARNTRSIRWLKWLGFEMGQPEPYGALNLPFIKFKMER
jgi:hypothetical protein